jgi:shikimate kinase
VSRTDGALAGRHVVLVGLMGVGKTTVGAIVARRLGRELVDSDARIESTTGRTVKEILAGDGIAELRRVEAAVLFGALAEHEPAVIAAAAGVVLDADHRRRLSGADAHVVWLDGNPALLAPRTATRHHRPWLDDDAPGTLRRMHDERAPWYREVADSVVDIDGLTPDAIADRILA